MTGHRGRFGVEVAVVAPDPEVPAFVDFMLSGSRRGETLRTAHRILDAEPLPKPSDDQHAVSERLARTVRALAMEEGERAHHRSPVPIRQRPRDVQRNGTVALVQ
ncbi:hypothetical protein [Streptomyces sp. NPDC002467]|uniref:hypothetical protein n=1 Tax=Streptomyces sp. NPDC002467 TaxID=3364647 RepID=UPI0036CA22C9